MPCWNLWAYLWSFWSKYVIESIFSLKLYEPLRRLWKGDQDKAKWILFEFHVVIIFGADLSLTSSEKLVLLDSAKQGDFDKVHASL